jgi:WD40 repeat protein
LAEGDPNLQEIVAELAPLPCEAWPQMRCRWNLSDEQWQEVLERLKYAETQALSPLDKPHYAAQAVQAIQGESEINAVNMDLTPTDSAKRRYRVLERIGKGGWGTVYKAEQRYPFKRTVALKMITAGVDTPDVVARFDSERQALARMDHTNIARVFDAGSTCSGRPYFVMEYVPGEPITIFADRNKLTVSDRLELFLQVCSAVNHAHTKAVIHRDIKAGNVLAFVQDGRPVAKVIDFGISKALTGDRLTEKTFNTYRGQVVGTYESMSPEQAGGSPDIDIRSDVYSLGVLLYELLCGAKPFDPVHLSQVADEEIRRVILEVEPQRPSTRLNSLGEAAAAIASARQASIDALSEQFRDELEWIPLMAMRKERDRRYNNVLQLAQDVRSYLDHEPLLAAPESAGYIAKKFVRRHKFAIAIAAVVVLSVLTGLGAAAWGLVAARAGRVLAQQERSRAEDSERRALDGEARARSNADQADRNAHEAKRSADEAKVNAEAARRNAAEARANAREAERRSVQSLLAEADAQQAAARWADAGSRLDEARNKLEVLGLSSLRADLSLSKLFAHAPPSVLKIATTPLRAIEVSPDGSVIYTGHEDGKIRAWDTYTRHLIAEWQAHSGLIFRIRLAADGHHLLSCGSDNRMRLSDLDDFTHKRVVDFPHLGWVLEVHCSADGQTILTRAQGGVIRLWSPSSTVPLKILKDTCHAAAITPNGHIAFFANNFDIRTYDISRDKLVSSLAAHKQGITCLAVSPDGKILASAARGWDIKLWKIEERGLQPLGGAMLGHSEWIETLRFSPDGRRLASCSHDGTVRLWDTGTGAETLSLTGNSAAIYDAAFFADGKSLACAGQDGTIRLWSVTTSDNRSMDSGCAGTLAVAVTRDGRLAFLGNKLGLVSVVDIGSGRVLKELRGRWGSVSCIAAPDGERVLFGSADGVVRQWRIVNNDVDVELHGHNGAVRALACSPNGRLAVSAAGGEAFRVWDLGTGQTLRTFGIASGWQETMAISPDGNWVLASQDPGYNATIWDLSSGAKVLSLDGAPSVVIGMDFSPDGRSVLTANSDQNARQLDIRDGSQRRVLKHVASRVIWPSGIDVAVSGGENGTLNLWDMRDGGELQTLDGGHTRVLSLAATHGMDDIVVGEENALVVWHLANTRRFPQKRSEAEEAINALSRDSGDARAMNRLGEWYAFRHFDAGTIHCLTRARDAGADINHTLLAHAYWNAGRLGEASAEFSFALNSASDPSTRLYLTLCAQAATSH